MPSMSPKTTRKAALPVREHVDTFYSLETYLEEIKKSGFIGHEDILSELYWDIVAHKLGLHAGPEPITTRILCGKTGQGKSYLVKTLAYILHGSEANLVKIDCGEYQLDHEVAKLVGCLVPDSPVTMHDGTTKKIVDIKVGDKVISGFGNVKEVLDTYEYDYKGQVAKVDVAFNSHQLTLTPEHKIWAIKGSREDGKRIRNPRHQYDKSKLSYIPVSELTKGDIVVCPRFKTTDNHTKILDLAGYAKDKIGIEITDTHIITRQVKFINRFINVDKSFMRFAGYYVAEGGFNGNRFSLCFGTNEVKSEATQDALTLLPKILGEGNQFSEEDRSDRNSIRLWFSSVPVVELLKDLFGDHTLNKKIPDWFLELPDELLYEFLDAAFAGDGGKTVPRRIDYSTSSPQLAQQVRTVLHKLGYAVQIQHHTNGEWSDRYRLYIAGPQIVNLCDKLPLVGKYIDLQLDKNIPFIQRQSFVDDDYVYYRINSVTFEEYDGKVYDISVNEDVNYIVDVSIKNSPPGYLGHRETVPRLNQAQINAVTSEKSNISIILFDEIEKGAPSLHRLLLGMLDHGTLRLGDNTVANFSRSMVFFTSNLGVKSPTNIGLIKNKGHAVSRQSIQEQTIKQFAPEFINRVGKDHIHFLKLNGIDDYINITNFEIEKISKMLLQNYSIYIDNVERAAIDFILSKCNLDEYGGRDVNKVVKDLLRKASLVFIRDNVVKKSDMVLAIDLYLDNDKLSFKYSV